MSNQSAGNEDWIKREQGRIPTKGAMAAERASAGLGTSDDESTRLAVETSSPVSLWAKPVDKKSPPARK
jgi:hypothetical protein